MELLWIITTLGLAYWIHKLHAKIDNLEAKVTRNVGQKGPAPQVPHAAASIQTDEATTDTLDRSKWPKHLRPKTGEFKTATNKTKPKTELMAEPFDLENFLGSKLFPILGAASIVVAIGFFSLWAFSNGWVGPMGRIAIGTLVSLGLVGLGEYLRPRYPDFFSYISAAGIAGLIITTLLSHYVYDFVTSFQSLALLALQAGVGIMLALRYNSRVLANFSITAGLLAPWFTGALDPMIILPFVLVLSGAGFVIATQKKWREIFIALIVLSSSYIFAALNELSTGAVNPVLLIIFAASIYGLVGSAGIVRLILNYKTEEPPPEENGEILIFSLSLLLFNVCTAVVFSIETWPHIGFLVAAQAVGLLSLAQWFKSQKWHNFHLLTLSSCLGFIILATIVELKDFDALVLTLALTIQGALMCAIGQTSKQKTYEWFGRLTQILAFLIFITEWNQDFVAQLLGTLVLVAALVYSVGHVKSMAEKIWLGVVLFLATGLVFNFSFNAPSIPILLEPVLPAIWFFHVLFVAYRQNSLFMRIAAALIFILLAVSIIDSYSTLNDLSPLVTWLWIALCGGFLYALQIQTGRESNINQIISYGSLGVLTLSWLIRTTDTLTEPLITLSWLTLAAILMTLGLRQTKWFELRHLSMLVLLIVVAKLFLIDIWAWETPIRVMAFTALGLVLLGIGFFYQKIWIKK
jgi:uncharacterized membrane protein